MQRHICLIALCFFCLMNEVNVKAKQNNSVVLSPGMMGPKAFPVPRISPAKVEKHNSIIIGIESHVEPNHEFSINPKLDFFIPWGDKVVLKIFTEPFEYYRTSESLRAKRHAQQKKGVAKGDIYFGALFTLFHKLEQQFYLAFNFQTKTTTGKQLENARHFNAPAYVFDLTFQKDRKSSLLGGSLHFFGYVSFLAWQSQFNQQNDALGIAVKTLYQRKGFHLSLEYGAYWGWQKVKDQPMVYHVEVQYPLAQTDFFIRYSYGLRDYVAHTLSFGSFLRL